MNHHYAKGAGVARDAAIAPNQIVTATSALVEEKLHPIFRFPRAAVQAYQRLGKVKAISKVLAWRHPDTNASEKDALQFIIDSLNYFKHFELNKDT